MAEPQTAARGLRITVRDPAGKSVDLVGSPFHIAGATAVWVATLNLNLGVRANVPDRSREPALVAA